MKTILVIEADEQIRTYLLKILELKGYRLLEAEDGVTGVQIAKSYLPDLVICDSILPALDGDGVLTQLRQQAETTTIPVILIRAKADRAIVQQGVNLAADGYLTQPFTSAELLETVVAQLEKPVAILPYAQDIKQAAARLSNAAVCDPLFCDPLTNLPNRMMLRQRLQEVLQPQDQVDSAAAIAVLCLNFDRFQTVAISGDAIASKSFASGDALLQAAANRLVECISASEALHHHHCLLARIGGDEFGLVLEGVDQAAVGALAARLLDAMAAPFEFGDQRIHIRARIGIAIPSRDFASAEGSSADRLMMQADMASHWSQQGSYQFFTPAITAAKAERQWLEADLKQALARSEFQLYYQPQVNVTTGQVIGIEALLRWQHPQHGLMLPHTFMAAAEEMGLMVKLSEWVLRTACAQMQNWQRLSLMPLRMTVNLTTKQFQQPELVTIVNRVLAQTGFDPKLLVLEITETSILNEMENTIARLTALRQRGIEISIDDFGNSDSSLHSLHHFPIQALKIARSFISQMTKNPQDGAIVTAMIAMANSLKLKVIAAGVETEAQLAFLQQQGCLAYQGNLYSPALQPQQVEKLLTAAQRLV